MRPRLLAVLGALVSLVVGAGLGFGAMVADDAARAPGSFGSGFGMLALVVAGLLTPAAVAFWLGLAFVPTYVRAADKHRAFAPACALTVGALLCFATVMLFFVTWPLGALMLVGAVLLFRYSLRRPVRAAV